MSTMNSLMQTPYNLKAGHNTSAHFYRTLTPFTDRVVARANEALGDFYEDFQQMMESRTPARLLLLDVLIFSTLWHTYSGLHIRGLSFKKATLQALYKARRYPLLKPKVDNFRGRLATAWLAKRPQSTVPLNQRNVKALLNFLYATCEFNEELKRINRLLCYLQKLPEAEKAMRLSQWVQLGRWFREEAPKVLGAFTQGWQAFIDGHHRLYKAREDYFFCGRSQPEYHLNMVGAELMNRHLAEEFQQTTRKILLLPTCMAVSPSCKARYKNRDLTCMHCRRDCPVSKTSRAMHKNGVRTVLIRHSSKFSEWLKPWAGQKSTALIGTACVLNLLQGGFEMMRLGIPSQCIFLDLPGCQKHWLSKRTAEVSLEQLSGICGQACANKPHKKSSIQYSCEASSTTQTPQMA